MRKLIFPFFLFGILVVGKGQSWSALETGLDGSVNALCVDSISNLLYVGGTFQNASGIPAHFIASWNGNSWAPIGTESMNSYVSGLVIYNGELYAGGNFNFIGSNSIPYFAKWNGNNWSSVSPLFNAPVGLLLVHNGALYGLMNSQIFKWDGSNLTYVPSPDGNVYALESYDSNLIAGGRFTTASGNTVNYIAKWDGTSWSAVGDGFNSFVDELKSYDGYLYAGGEFTFSGGTPANSIARWDGNNWNSLGDGITCNGNFSSVWSIVRFNNIIYAGGGFCKADGKLSISIAQWNGSEWDSLGSGVNNGVENLAIFQNDLYEAGGSPYAGGILVNYIAKWGSLTGLEKISNISCKIYPNPFTDKVIIKTNIADIRNLKIKINDIYGKVVTPLINFNSKVIEIKRGNLPNGVYFIRIWNGKDLIESAKLMAM